MLRVTPILQFIVTMSSGGLLGGKSEPDILGKIVFSAQGEAGHFPNLYDGCRILSICFHGYRKVLRVYKINPLFGL